MKSFSLERTWRATGVGTVTFNTSGNFTMPYGKAVVEVTGRAGTGTNPSGNTANYNPTTGGNPNYNPYYPGNPLYNSPVPGNPNYNPYVPSNIAGYNPPTANYNEPYYFPGGEFVAYDYPYGYPYVFYIPAYTVPGNVSGESPGNPNYNPEVNPTVSGYNPDSPGTIYSYNPASGGNLAGYNPTVPGNISGYNPYVPGDIGGNTTVLGVYFPGGAAGGGVAPVVANTSVNTYVYTDLSVNPITVPSGGYITITIS